MTTYKTKDGIEYQRYEKFTTKTIAGLTWIPLLVGENRVRYFESSQLTEVGDPRLTGMVYCYPAIPQNFDSGLLYTVAEPPKPLTVVLTPEMAAHVNASALVEIVVRQPVAVSLWADGLRVA